MTDKWFIAKNGPNGAQQFGPFTFDQLRQLASTGRLLAADLIWRQGTTDWIAAGTAGLFLSPATVQSAIPNLVAPVPTPIGGLAHGLPTHALPLSSSAQRVDRLEGYWYAIIWLSLLIPVVGTWVIVILSSVMYYAWRRDYPVKAKAINLHGWLAFATAHTVCCLGWASLSALQQENSKGRPQAPVPVVPAARLGQELNFNGGQLFFTASVTRDEANRLGQFLVREKLFDGDPKTVQLDKQGRTYSVRIVIKKGVDQDRETIELMRLLAAHLSAEVFYSAPVDIHLCDENLATVRVVVPL